jgi:Spinocerebellar ataxia type 10 protein domain
MDEHNPTMREWCLMIIRNMCQSSDQVRQILQNMKKAGDNGQVGENDEEVIK